MGLSFNLNFNIELGYETPKKIIEVFTKKSNGLLWDNSDKEVIPFHEIEYLLETSVSSKEKCLQVFYFQKQDYIVHPNVDKNNFYCFHLNATIGDDDFYENVLQFINWIVQFSLDDGFLGEFREITSNKINLLYCKNKKLIIEEVSPDLV